MNLLKNNKKEEMFGLDLRALKKQSCELFLARRQSAGSQETNDSCGYSKRGAMFGLDARIALAIFGALSVISGAALYSAIEKARSTSLHQSLVEIAKASEQYLLDTRRNIPEQDATSLKANLIINNVDNIKNWNGPYFSGIEDGSGFRIDILGLETWATISLLQSSDWTNSVTFSYCTIGDLDCSEWVRIGLYNAKLKKLINYFEPMDLMVDNSDGKLKGRLRMITDTSGTTRIFYKIRPRVKYK